MKKCSISIVLIIAMVLSFSSVSFAAQHTANIYDSVITPIPSSDGHEWAIKGEYFADGTIQINLIQDGLSVSSSVLNQEKHTITSTTASTNEVEVLSYDPVLSHQTRASYFNVGVIDYSHTAGSDIRKAQIAYRSSFDNTHYDVNGTYKSMASLVTLMIGVLLLPQAVSTAVAAKILGYCALGIDAVNFLIPSHIVDTQSHEMNWRAMFTTPTGPYSEVVGYKYVVTQPGESGIYYSGSYYPASDFTNKNRNLATSLYDNAFWSYDESYGTPVKWTMSGSRNSR